MIPAAHFLVWDYQGVNSWGIFPTRRWRRKQFPDPKRRWTRSSSKHPTGDHITRRYCLPRVTYRTTKRPSATDVPSTNRLAISLHVLRCESLRRPSLSHRPLYSVPLLSSKPVSLEEKIPKRIKQTNPHHHHCIPEWNTRRHHFWVLPHLNLESPIKNQSQQTFKLLS